MALLLGATLLLLATSQQGTWEQGTPVPSAAPPSVRVVAPVDGEKIGGLGASSFMAAVEVQGFRPGIDGDVCLLVKRVQDLADRQYCQPGTQWTLENQTIGTYLVEAELRTYQGQLAAKTQGYVQIVLGEIHAPVSETFDIMMHLVEKALGGTGDSDCHLLTFFSMVLQVQAKLVLELGVREGVSTLPLLLGASMTGGRLLSVDFFENVFVPPQHLQKHWQFFREHSLNFLHNLRPEIIFDLVFIDDWHAYDHVKKEMELLEPHVTKQSIILMHDSMTRTCSSTEMETNPGVPCDRADYHNVQDMGAALNFAGGGPGRVIQELDRNKWEYSTIPRCDGLTIVRRLY